MIHKMCNYNFAWIQFSLALAYMTRLMNLCGICEEEICINKNILDNHLKLNLDFQFMNYKDFQLKKITEKIIFLFTLICK